jgi:hypothetical protein
VKKKEKFSMEGDTPGRNNFCLKIYARLCEKYWVQTGSALNCKTISEEEKQAIKNPGLDVTNPGSTVIKPPKLLGACFFITHVQGESPVTKTNCKRYQ